MCLFNAPLVYLLVLLNAHDAKVSKIPKIQAKCIHGHEIPTSKSAACASPCITNKQSPQMGT